MKTKLIAVVSGIMVRSTLFGPVSSPTERRRRCIVTGAPLWRAVASVSTRIRTEVGPF